VHLAAVFVGGKPVAAGSEVRGDPGERGQEPLRTARGAEAPHRSFPRPGGLVGVLGAIVEVLRAAVLHSRDQPAVGHPVAGELIGDQHPGHVRQPLEQLAEEPGRGLRVAAGGDQDVQHAPILVHRTPQIVGLPTDLDEYLVKVPFVPGAGPAPA
jgi:hypothetical protein